MVRASNHESPRQQKYPRIEGNVLFVQLPWAQDWKNITSLKTGKTQVPTASFGTCLCSSISNDPIHGLVYVHNSETLWSIHNLQAVVCVWPHLLIWLNYTLRGSWLMVLKQQSYWEEQPGKKNVLDGKTIPDPEPIIRMVEKLPSHRMEAEVLSLMVVFQWGRVAKSTHANVLRVLPSCFIWSSFLFWRDYFLLVWLRSKPLCLWSCLEFPPWPLELFCF